MSIARDHPLSAHTHHPSFDLFCHHHGRRRNHRLLLRSKKMKTEPYRNRGFFLKTEPKSTDLAKCETVTTLFCGDLDTYLHYLYFSAKTTLVSVNLLYLTLFIAQSSVSLLWAKSSYTWWWWTGEASTFNCPDFHMTSNDSSYEDLAWITLMLKQESFVL